MGSYGARLREQTDDPARDIAFFSTGVRVDPPWFGAGTPARVYFSGASFELQLGEIFSNYSLWVTEEGLQALIGDMQAALVRARIARES